MSPVIQVEGLRQHYGAVRAVEDVFFEVHQGGIWCGEGWTAPAISTRVFRWE